MTIRVHRPLKQTNSHTHTHTHQLTCLYTYKYICSKDNGTESITKNVLTRPVQRIKRFQNTLLLNKYISSSVISKYQLHHGKPSPKWLFKAAVQVSWITPVIPKCRSFLGPLTCENKKQVGGSHVGTVRRLGNR